MLAGKAHPDVPRWRRRKAPPPGPLVTVKGRGAKKLARELAVARAQAYPVERPQSPLASSQVFRFRFHLVPFWWLTGLLAAGLGAHAARLLPLATITAILVAAGIILLTRHVSGFARHTAWAIAGLTVFLLPALAVIGPHVAVPVTLGCWAAVTIPWVAHYRWRYQDPPPQPQLTDPQIWEERIASKKAKGTWLAEPGQIPGGRTWTVMLPQGDIVPANILSIAPHIAGAWDKATTEVVVEPYPDGRQSRCKLTILKSGTLAKVREWDGRGADPATGRAVIGRFADGQDASIRLWVPRDGTRHGLLAGATGSGKTYTLDLIVRVAVASGLVAPVILDPQEGQSLPQWRGHVPYASGTGECMDMLEGVHSAVLGRSRRLADWDWVDEDGHQMHGMDFFDPHMTGLPVVLVIGDELPLLLKADSRADQKRADRAVMMLGNISKVARKAGAAVWVVTQVPSLEELVSRVLRSMLAGCNLVCLRTGERADAAMIGLEADPFALPRYFPDGTPTTGLGYVVGPELRQAPARIDLVPRRVRRVIPQVPELDTMFAAATRL